MDPNQAKKVREIEVDHSQGADSREFSTRNQSLNRSGEASSSPLLHVFLGFGSISASETDRFRIRIKKRGKKTVMLCVSLCHKFHDW